MMAKFTGGEYLRTIEAALHSGGIMHAFLSGGGLRVVRIEKPRHGKLLAYGEHPHVTDALRIMAEDLIAGGRPYADVYGKAEEHYLTGASEPNDELDAWVRQGQTFDAHAKNDTLVFELRGFARGETPDDVLRLVLAGETVRWTDPRGVVFESYPSRFPNGATCCGTRIVTLPASVTEHTAWMWRIVKRGTGSTLLAAIHGALTSKQESTEGDS